MKWVSRRPAHTALAVLCLSAAVTAACSPSRNRVPHTAGTGTIDDDRLRSVIDRFLDEHGEVLGALARVDLPGQTAAAAAGGHFDLSRQTRLGSGDRFSIGSTTKTFTATVVFQLIEEDAIDLDDAIVEHLPEEWAEVLSRIEHGEEVTVGQALSHRSGMYDYIVNLTFFRGLLGGTPWTPLGLLELVAREGRPNSPPGGPYRYCNTNYLLLGALVEHETRQPLHRVLDGRLLSRLGLEDTYLSRGLLGSGRPDVARGYFTEQGELHDMQQLDSGWAWAAGGIISSADDLNRFLRGLVAGEPFENASTFDRMARLRLPEGRVTRVPRSHGRLSEGPRGARLQRSDSPPDHPCRLWNPIAMVGPIRDPRKETKVPAAR